MRNPTHSLLNAVPLILQIFVSTLAQTADLPEHPYPEVTFKHDEKKSPPQLIYTASINLAAPGVVARVVRGGPDPDGPGEWQTTLMRPTKIADREGFDVVINGDFFAHFQGKDAEGPAAQAQFKASTMAKVTGVAETDGVVWSKSEIDRPMLIIDDKGVAAIVTGKQPPQEARQAIAGHDMLVHNGKNVAAISDKPGFVKGPHPRTAVGLKNGGKTLILVVVDGRKKGVATGMSLSELAAVLLEEGAEEAINLDGGGSSVLAIRDPQTKKLVIVNHPSDGAERPVANALGVKLGSGK